MTRITVHPKKVKINRLFLIGNGFDISLGLKTKYNDFLLWLLKREVINAHKSGIRHPPFDKYKGKYDEWEQTYHQLFVDGYSENKLFDVIINYKQFKIPIEDIEIIDDLKEFLLFSEKSDIEFKVSPTFIFMNKLLESSKENWVDIENIYFTLLKQIITEKKKNYKKLIIAVNQELTEIIIYLKEYLTSLDITIDKPIAAPHFKFFNENLNIEDFLEFEERQKIEIGVNYFLNFNYTDTVTKVLNHYQYTSTQNFIHGNLIDEEIIFGFGDEMDKFYKEIEELNDNEFFRHIKSFHYFKTPSQRKLQTFLNSGLYQVCVYGHSCGLSDRVMLNEIFEHENCKSIKIYYYNDEDFTTKTMEISRHFNSNQMMRKKIVNKSKECLIPQYTRNK